MEENQKSRKISKNWRKLIQKSLKNWKDIKKRRNTNEVRKSLNVKII